MLRTFRWRVGTDGRVVPHPEQAAGLGIGPNAFLVETILPASGAAFDTRVHRESVEQAAFYGLGFRSPEGRAMAAALPSVGSPAPPQPRAASGAARRRAAARPRRR